MGICKKLIVSSILSGLIFLSHGAIAQPEITKNINYYDINGWNEALLHEQMDAKGPNDRNTGKRVWAHTHWRVTWNFDYQEENTSCTMTAAHTTVELTFTVPRWIDREEATPAVQEKWDRFYAALQKHEHVHAMNGVNAALEIEEKVRNLGTQRICKTIEDEAQRIADEVIEKYSTMDIVYDEKTRHGLTDGVTL